MRVSYRKEGLWSGSDRVVLCVSLSLQQKLLLLNLYHMIQYRVCCWLNAVVGWLAGSLLADSSRGMVIKFHTAAAEV